MTDHPDLTGLLGSRICHDLISPIGAIGNGVELLLMDGAARGPEMALISESVASANARVRFFRIAYGISEGDQRIGRPEVEGILNGIAQGGRVALNWQTEKDVLRREAKLAFLGIQCIETALAFGGRITVSTAGTGWTLTANAPRLKADPALWHALATAAAPQDLSPSRVQFALLPAELQRQSRRLTATLHETEIRLAW